MTTATENYHHHHHQQSLVRHSHRLQPWRLINNGLNIEGLCTNYRCQASNQMVVINLGFGEYDFARIILERKNKCPLCKNPIHPTKYALHKCQWWFVNHYSTQTYPLNKVNNKYELKDLHCEYLIIETMPLPKYQHNRTKSQEITCSICLGNIENDNDTSYLQCSHRFHRNCLYRWLESSASMANTCPLCRTDIAEKF